LFIAGVRGGGSPISAVFFQGGGGWTPLWVAHGPPSAPPNPPPTNPFYTTPPHPAFPSPFSPPPHRFPGLACPPPLAWPPPPLTPLRKLELAVPRTYLDKGKATNGTAELPD